MKIELAEEDILCEMQSLAKNIVCTDDIVSAEESAKKISWLMELWEEYKK